MVCHLCTLRTHHQRVGSVGVLTTAWSWSAVAASSERVPAAWSSSSSRSSAPLRRDARDARQHAARTRLSAAQRRTWRTVRYINRRATRQQSLAALAICIPSIAFRPLGQSTPRMASRPDWSAHGAVQWVPCRRNGLRWRPSTMGSQLQDGTRRRPATSSGLTVPCRRLACSHSVAWCSPPVARRLTAALPSNGN